MGIRDFMVECTTLPNLTMRGGRDVELQNPKRPTDYRDCGTSPFFEGDRSLKQNTKKGDVCAANNHRQKNGGLERTYLWAKFEQISSSRSLANS